MEWQFMNCRYCKKVVEGLIKCSHSFVALPFPQFTSFIASYPGFSNF